MSWRISPQYKDPDYSSVSLLLHGNGTNGSTTITDSSLTPKAVTAVGNAQISTAIADPFGSSTRGVIAFDGSGDYLSLEAGAVPAFGANNFTIEFWYRPSSIKVALLIDFRKDTATDLCPNIYQFNNELYYATGPVSNAIFTANVFTVNTWFHIAASRSSGVTKMFVNGSQVGASYTDNNSYIAGRLFIGAYPLNLLALNPNGYMDDIRITNGVARYTSNFSVPPAPFPDI